MIVKSPINRSQSQPQRVAQSRGSGLIGCCLAIAVGCLTLWVIPLGAIFQMDPDEGIQLAKATLYQQGFALYTEIWSDHPPLYTILLAAWLNFWGHSIVAARCLTLGFTAVLVWALGRCIQLTTGWLAAILAIGGLISSSFFLQLSASVMIGLPAIALALVAIWLVLKAEQSARFGWLIGSGLGFALALQIKLIPIFLLPAISLYLFTIPTVNMNPRSERLFQALPAAIVMKMVATFSRLVQPISTGLPSYLRAGNWAALGVWLGSFLGTTLILVLTTAPPSWQQVIQAHFTPSLRQTYDWWADIDNMLKPFALDYDLIIWAGFGIVMVTIQKRWRHLGLWWFITIIPLLVYHQPFWYHYHPLIIIPAVWLGAEAIAGSIELLNRRWRRSQGLTPAALSTGLVFVLCIAISLHLVPSKWNEVQDDIQQLIGRSQGYQQALTEIQTTLNSTPQSSQSTWLYTDLPMYGFYAGLSVPPELAVISNKRVQGGNLTDADVNQILSRYQPDAVVLGRIQSLHDAFKQQFSAEYELISEHPISKDETVFSYQRSPS